MPLDGLEPVARGRATGVPDPDDFAIWMLRLDLADDALTRCSSFLSAEERERAARYRRRVDGTRFVAARGQLREVLARYIDAEPGRIEFARSSAGKPSLAGGRDANCLHFSFSGSEALALVAIRRGCEVGVDVEAVRAMPDSDDLAERLLAQDERAEYSRVSGSQRERRLLEYWVRKEAIAKALGTGLAEGLERLSLAPWPGSAAMHVNVPRTGGAVSHWVVALDLPFDGFVGAVASQRPFDAIDIRRWETPAAR